MRKLALSTLALVGLLGAAPAVALDDAKPVVVIATNLGDITVELEPQKASKTVENFLGYVDGAFYDGTVFHRVIPGFMIQGGGMTADMKEKGTKAPVKNESKNGLSNLRGSIAMARTNNPDSATAQFFINVADNKQLDTYGGGYTVFGRVLEGMDVADKIVAVKTVTRGPLEDVPAEPILIKSIKRKAQP